jgi:ABC-type transport system involved in multi-copper enzyme maturation permease subunit
MASLSIARLVVLESVRRRLAPALALLTLAAVALSAWGFGKLAGHDAQGHGLPPVVVSGAVAVIVTLLAFMFSTMLALGAAFLGATSLGSELENGTLLAILPRPLRRIEVLAGKWLGVFALVAGYGLIAIGLEALVIRWRTGYLAPHPLEALLYIGALVALTLTCAMALSMRLAPLTAAFVTIVLYGASWIDGIVHLIGRSLHNDGVTLGTLAVGLVFPSDGLWRGVLYELQPAILQVSGAGGSAAAGPFAVSGGPTSAFLAWCAVWAVGAAWAGVTAFRRRDV